MANENVQSKNFIDGIQEQVALRVCIIGVGNAGNQIASAASKEGYSAFAINSSSKDLNDSVVNPNMPAYIITGDSKMARGAGKNRERAKSLFKSSGNDLFTNNVAFSTMIDEADIIFIVGSTGGGTGSGVCPELASLLNNYYSGSKLVIFYGILPKLSESLMAQYNTMECINEILGLKIPYMLDDLDYYNTDPNDVAYKGIAKHVIESINTINGKYLHFSSSGMIDENDMLSICGQIGYMSIYSLNSITAEQLDKDSIQTMMINRIKKSPAVSIDRDGFVKHMGIIVNSPEELIESSKTGNYDELYKFIGTPIGVSENYSISTQTTCQFILIISGMNAPNIRMLKIKEKLEALAPSREKTLDLNPELDHFRSLKDAGTVGGALFGDKAPETSAKNDVLNSYFSK